MKICLYHNADLDGVCSAAITKQKFPDIILVGVNYGDDYTPDPGTQLIVIVDFSFSYEKMLSLQAVCPVIWIDHHISNIRNKKFLPNTKVILQDGVSACELAWRHFFPDKMLPVAVHLLGIYDTWRKNERPTIPATDHKVTDHWLQIVLPFQYYCRSYFFDTERIHILFSKWRLDKEIDLGTAILKYITQQNKILATAAFERNVEGYRAIVLNQGKINSMAFDHVYDTEKHDLMLAYSFNGNLYRVSLYTDKDSVDVSAIAQKFGGGGHRAAAGCQISNMEELWQTGIN